MNENKIHNTILNKKTTTAIWLMRQAGRYLPEYRAVREQAGSFLKLCYNPELAVKVTLQPIKRFDFDAAIIFSDILLIPQAMGQKLEFIENEGPKLEKITNMQEISKLTIDNISSFLAPVYQAIRQTRQELASHKSLIGFAGGAWTIATYMLEGSSNRDFIASKKLALNQPEILQQLIDKLVLTISEHLINQVEAGADLLQIFDSWAGVLAEEQFTNWIVKPTQKIIKIVKAKYPHIKIIGFPRGAGFHYKEYAELSGVDVLNIDSQVPCLWAKEHLQNKIILQGNLDPITLLADKPALKEQLTKIINNLAGSNFIFNLGHGVLPSTPIENIEFLVQYIRNEHR